MLGFKLTEGPRRSVAGLLLGKRLLLGNKVIPRLLLGNQVQFPGCRGIKLGGGGDVAREVECGVHLVEPWLLWRRGPGDHDNRRVEGAAIGGR